MAKTSKLTVKQEEFCRLYAATGNAVQSFKEAGYKWVSEQAARKNASNLIHNNSNVKKKLQDLREQADKDCIADIQEMQATLTKIIREELDEEQLMTEGCGNGFSKTVSRRKKAALKDRLRAIELLAKMQGGFVDKVEVSGNLPVQIIDDIQE